MKIYQGVLVLCCFILVASLCHASEEEPEPTEASVYREKGVTVILPEMWEPYCFADESGERTGYLVQMWRAWSEQSGIDVRFEFMDQAGALERLEAGTADILGGMYALNTQPEFLVYTDAVRSSSSVLVIRDDGPVDCANSLWEGPVGVIDEKDTLRSAKAKYSEAELVMFPDAQQAVEAFLAGKLDALVIGYPRLAEIGGKLGVMDDLTICRTLLWHDVYGAVQAHETELLELVNEGLSNVPSERLKQIESRWFLTAEMPSPDWLSASLPAAVMFVVILGIVVLWIRRRR